MSNTMLSSQMATRRAALFAPHLLQFFRPLVCNVSYVSLLENRGKFHEVYSQKMTTRDLQRLSFKRNAMTKTICHTCSILIISFPFPWGKK